MKKTITAPAEAKGSDLAAIVDSIKGDHDIILDLSKTKIKTIRKEAFKECNGLKAIILPEGLESIGDWAFYNCEALSQITIPSNVTSIGKNAFGKCCSLEQITFADPSGWYSDRTLTQSVEPRQLASWVKAGAALYNKDR